MFEGEKTRKETAVTLKIGLVLYHSRVQRINSCRMARLWLVQPPSSGHLREQGGKRQRYAPHAGRRMMFQRFM